MSVRERVLVSPVVDRTKRFEEAYGMGMLFAANVFGAGSVYILSTTGAQFGYLLLWTMPGPCSWIWECTRCRGGWRPSTGR